MCTPVSPLEAGVFFIRSKMIYYFPRLSYQNRWMDWAASRERVANFSGTGTGKTVMTLDWLNSKNYLRVLIICPKSTMKTVWHTAIEDNYTADTIDICRGTKKKRLKILEEHLTNGFRSVLIINYDLLVCHERELSLLRFDCVVLDESHKITGQSKRSDACKNICRDIPACSLLSGTPDDGKLLQYYNQLNLITRTPGTFQAWRSKNFDAFTIPNTNITTYTPLPGVRDKILQAVARLSFTASADEEAQLPDRSKIALSYQMGEPQRKVYDAISTNGVVTINGKDYICDSNSARATKLLQISSGFIYDEQKNPLDLDPGKMDLLKDVLKNNIKDEQCIIWYRHRHEMHQICDELGMASYTELNQDSRDRYIKDFMAGKNKYFIASARSCAEGIELFSSRYEIWYGAPQGLVAYLQACDRIYRLGQKRNVISISLQAEDSYEEHYHDCLMNGVDEHEAVTEFFKKESRRND